MAIRLRGLKIVRDNCGARSVAFQTPQSGFPSVNLQSAAQMWLLKGILVHETGKGGGLMSLKNKKTNKKITAMTSQAQETCITTADLLFFFCLS